MQSWEEIKSYVEREEVEFIDFKVVDLFGRWRHLTIPVSQFQRDVVEEGIGFDGSNYGYRSVSRSDMLFKPDLATVRPDHFYEKKTLSIIGNIYEAGSEVERYSGDPRAVAERTEQVMADSGAADGIHLLLELEFYLFDRVFFEDELHRGGFSIDAQNAFWNSGNHNSNGFFPRKKDGYHTLPPHDILADMRNEIVSLLESNGVEVKYHHHEVGGPGQVELETSFGGLLQMCDNTLLAKYVIRNTAARHGKTVTFMPKCLHGEAGNGMHIHQFLTRGGKNIFHDENGYEKLSETCLHYLGGILYHANSLCAFTNASTNSYRRLVPGFEAPVSRVFAAANRSAAVRIPTYVRNADYRRIEYRPIDAAGNPYLAYSAMVLAGLDGIINRIDPVEEGFGPFEGDLYQLAAEEQQSILRLPRSLEEALEALENDHGYLLRGKAFSPQLIENWIAQKKREVQLVNERPHPYEFMLYYDL